MEPAHEAWIVNGIPGAGKSTIARLLAGRLPRSAYIEGDRIHHMVVGGYVSPGAEPIDERKRQLDLAAENQCRLARGFLQACFVPIVDYVYVAGERIRWFSKELAPAALFVVTLAPGPEVAARRDAERPEKMVRAERFGYLHELMCTGLDGIGLWIDNSRQTPEETLNEILARKSEARVR